MKYVPILKFRAGEQQAIKNLDEAISDQICPLFEIHKPKDGVNLSEQIAACWYDRPFFFYPTPDWYEEYEDINEWVNIPDGDFCNICKNQSATPVLDLSMLDAISDWAFLPQQGVAIRIRNNEFAEVENMLNPVFSSSPLKRATTDLILDLQYAYQSDLFAKESVLKGTLPYIDGIGEYRSIIISSCSFPKELPQMEVNRIYPFPRTESQIHAKALDLTNRFHFTYVYSDYGCTNLEEIQFEKWMSPNFKIKYSTNDEYLFIKGLPTKHGGLDVARISTLCSTLVNSGKFCGDGFSWADTCIYQLATGTAKNGGNLTTWVSYSMNHHMTLICRIL